MEVKKLKKQIRLLTMCSFLISILPLLITVACRWDNYVANPGDVVKLTFGGIMVAILLLFKALGRLKFPEKRVVGYLFALVLCFLLDNVLQDITFLLFMATIGEVADLIIFQHPIKVLKEKLQNEKTADATAEKLKKILDERGK